MGKFLIAMPECLPEKIQKHLLSEAKRYDTFHSFESELGWEDWMNNYTDAQDDDDLTQSEIETINSVLQYFYNKAH